MKKGDRIKLKSLNSLMDEYEWRYADSGNGIEIEGHLINKKMYYMFGKSWKVTEVSQYDRWDFIIHDPDTSSRRWLLMNSWIEESIIDVDELFKEIDI